MKISEEANILHPTETVKIGGDPFRVVIVPAKEGEIRVSEFNFGQVLQLEHHAAPLINSIVAAVTASGADQFDWNAFVAAAAAHPGILSELLAVATGETIDRLNSLSDRDGRNILMAFFKVNWDFFLDRVVVHAATKPDITDGPTSPPKDPKTH